MIEMFPESTDDAIDPDVARPSAWLTKAKLAVQGDKRVQPFVFQPEVSPIARLHSIYLSELVVCTCDTELHQAQQHPSCS